MSYCKYCGRELFEGEESKGICKKCEEKTPATSSKSSKDEAKLNSIFLEDDEKLIASLKSGWLRNLTLENAMAQEFVILSQKRVYYSGTTVGELGGRKGVRIKGLQILPLEKIDAIQFAQVQNMMLLVLGVLTLPLFGVGIIFLVAYFLTRKQALIIGTASASVEISFSAYGMRSIMDFAKALGKELSKKK
ncbi:MAG: hypothetical protein KAK00_06800 [Nanoarchaeota archaeon]|nr:hypothetical protein [Nanoarchaeota archaeon]